MQLHPVRMALVHNTLYISTVVIIGKGSVPYIFAKGIFTVYPIASQIKPAMLLKTKFAPALLPYKAHQFRPVHVYPGQILRLKPAFPQLLQGGDSLRTLS